MPMCHWSRVKPWEWRSHWSECASGSATTASDAKTSHPGGDAAVQRLLVAQDVLRKQWMQHEAAKAASVMIEII